MRAWGIVVCPRAVLRGMARCADRLPRMLSSEFCVSSTLVDVFFRGDDDLTISRVGRRLVPERAAEEAIGPRGAISRIIPAFDRELDESCCGHPTRRLRDRRAHRSRRHGRGLSRARYEAEARGGDQDPPRRLRGRSQASLGFSVKPKCSRPSISQTLPKSRYRRPRART